MPPTETNLTVPPDQFSIDNIPVEVRPRFFNDQDPDLPKITFRHPHTKVETDERSAVVGIFCFNGTALLTPSAFDQTCGDLNLDHIDPSRLKGPLLILDLESGVRYGRRRIRRLLSSQGIDLEMQEESVPEYIVLFRTRLMRAILEATDEKGIPDYQKLKQVQRGRPGITYEGARALQEIGLAKTFMVDNISFEIEGAKGFRATQALAAPHPSSGSFTPLIYHIGNTEGDNFAEKNRGKTARVELGNPPQKGLTGYPVAVYLS